VQQLPEAYEVKWVRGLSGSRQTRRDSALPELCQRDIKHVPGEQHNLKIYKCMCSTFQPSLHVRPCDHVVAVSSCSAFSTEIPRNNQFLNLIKFMILVDNMPSSSILILWVHSVHNYNQKEVTHVC
jgi:hypothetical protein